MNRQQLRDKAKRQEKLINKINSLPGDVLRGIEEMQRQAVATNSERILQQMDICYAAAIIAVREEEFSMDELINITNIANNYLIENGDFIEEFKEGWREYLDKTDLEIKERIMQLLDKEEKQIDIVKILRKEYPKLTSSHFNIAYKTAKEEYMKPKIVIANERVDFEKEKMLEMIKKEKGDGEVQKVIRTGVRAAETKANEVKVNEVKTSLKLKSKELIFEGEFGEYKILNGILKTGSLTFNSMDEIDRYEAAQLRGFKATMTELKQAWQEV